MISSGFCNARSTTNRTTGESMTWLLILSIADWPFSNTWYTFLIFIFKYRLPGEADESPSLEVFKSHTGVAVRDMVYWWTVILEGFSNWNDSVILWYCLLQNTAESLQMLSNIYLPVAKLNSRVTYCFEDLE